MHPRFQVHELFVSFDALLESGDYVRACGSVDRVSALVGSFSPDVCGDSRVLVCVRNQGRKQRSRLRARLAELCARAVAVEGGEVRVSKEVSGVFGHMHYEGVTPLPTLLRCAASVGLLDETMRTLAGKLKSQLLPPILAGTVRPHFVSFFSRFCSAVSIV